MKLQVVADEGAYAEISAQQEGAYVLLVVSQPDGTEDDEEREIRIDTMLTPDQAESLSFELSEVAKNARAHGIKGATR